MSKKRKVPLGVAGPPKADTKTQKHAESTSLPDHGPDVAALVAELGARP